MKIIIFLIIILFNVVESKINNGSFTIQKGIGFDTQQANSLIMIDTQILSLSNICLVKCLVNPECYILQFIENQCYFFSKYGIYHSILAFGSLTFYKNDPFPMYHWPVSDSKLFNVVGDTDFTSYSGISFTKDRFGTRDSAVRINNGKLVLPPKVYFNRDFTLMAWTKIDQLNYEMSMFSCSNNNGDLVHISYMGGAYRPYFAIYRDYTAAFINFQNALNTNEWYHITIGYKEDTAFVFLNGKLDFKKETHAPNSVLLTDCYFGSETTQAVLDEMKIFDYALNDDEILSHYHS